MNKNIIHIVTYKKEKGNLQIHQTTRKVTFNNNSKNFQLSIGEIKDVFKKPYNNKELLCIEDKTNTHHVFGFFGEGKTYFCNFFYDILKSRSILDFQKNQFSNLPFTEQKKIILLISDNYLKSLFDTVVLRHQILELNNFWYVMKKFHPERFCINLIELKIQPTRKDEIILKNSGNIKFNINLKNKILNSYEDVNTLFYYHLEAKKQKEEIFWDKFLKNQTNNQTEIVGGLNKIYIEKEDKDYLEEYKAKNKVKIKTEKGNDFFKDGFMNNRFEFIEKQNLFINKYDTHLVNIAEKEYSDLIKYHQDTYEKKETTNIINSLNDYSIRKIETLKFMPKDRFNSYLNKEKNKSNKNYKSLFTHSKSKLSLKSDGADVEMSNECQKINSNFNEVEMTNNSTSAKIEEMLKENSLKESKINSMGSYRTMKLLNKRFEKIAKNKESESISKNNNGNSQDRILTNKLIEGSSLLRDLKSLSDIAKDRKNNFSENAKLGLDNAMKETIESMKKKKDEYQLNVYQKDQIELILSLFE